MQSKLEQGRRTIFTTNQIFNIFQLFILAATIALLFPIDGYQIFIIEYRCKKKKIAFLPFVSSLKYGFAGFSK